MRSRPFLGILAIVFVLASIPSAQTVSDQEVKAAYLYSFAKFVDWPTASFSSQTSPIRLCLLNGDALESALRKTTLGKSIGTHPVEVVLVRNSEEYRTCHVLFVGPSPRRESKRILDDLQGRSVLTVGDADGFIRQGGIIGFVLNENRVQFEVNRKAALQGQLNISSRLLRVARTVME